MNSKAILRSLTPPVVWQLAHRLKHSGVSTRVGFEGPYSSWAAASSQATGWDSPLITEKTLAAALKVRDGQAVVEQDGLLRKQIPYSATILAFLLIAFARQKSGLDIIDFGGGLGSNYYQNRKVLHQLTPTPISWSVVERPIFANLGAEQFQSSELNFSSSLGDVLSRPAPSGEALLFSGSLQCVPDPFSLLELVVDSKIKLVAFDRVLVSPSLDHAIFVQNPDPNIYYQANYPVWCFSRDRMIKWLSDNGFSLVEHFTYNPETHFDHCGMIFVRQT